MRKSGVHEQVVKYHQPWLCYVVCRFCRVVESSLMLTLTLTHMHIARLCRPFLALISLLTHSLYNLYPPGSYSKPSLVKLCSRHAQISDFSYITSWKTASTYETPSTMQNLISPNHACAKIDLAKFSHNTTLLALANIFPCENFPIYGIDFY